MKREGGMVVSMGTNALTNKESKHKDKERKERNIAMKTWKIIGVMMMVLGVGALGFIPAGSADDKNIEQMITEAKTPSEHEAIAAYYKKEAGAAQEKYEEHLKLKAAYAKIPHLASKTGLPAHCDSIAKNYQKIGKEYEDLAKLHQDMAKSAK
jgi:hypothetical protein